MLDLALENVSIVRGGVHFENLSLRIPASTHTSLIGPPGCGKSALLDLFEGTLRPSSGRVLFGTRDLARVRPASRPVVHSARTALAPGRWSVRHLLVASARTRRSLDFEDRMGEIERAALEWGVAPLLDRKLRELSSHERLLCRLSQLVLLRPAVLMAERLFAEATSGTADALEDRFWRRLRAEGCTVIHEIAGPEEVGWADRAVLLEKGRIAAVGTPRELFHRAPTAELAELIAPSTAIPIEIAGDHVESVIGSWEIPDPPFQGAGVAIARPWGFEIVAPGEESDFLFGIEEARFLGARWELTGMLTGSKILRVWVPPEFRPTRGKLLPMRFDRADLQLFPVANAPSRASRGEGPTLPPGAIPSREETR